MSIESNPEDYYDQQEAADLLLFRNERNMKALRLEVPGLRKEFSDGVYIGKDPPGSIYYNTTADFERYQGGRDVNHRYTVTKYTRIVNSKTKIFVIVKFSNDLKPDYALFKGGDARNALGSSQMENYSHSGNWGELLNSNTPATLTKTKGQNELKLTLSKVSQVAKWTDKNQSLNNYEINIRGSANFKDINTLKNGVWARCNADRAVFYESDYLSKDLIAWFLPLKEEPDIPGPANTDSVFDGVVWSATT